MNEITGREGRGVTGDGVSRRTVWSQGSALMRLVKVSLSTGWVPGLRNCHSVSAGVAAGCQACEIAAGIETRNQDESNLT
jgi:hypothetical protein